MPLPLGSLQRTSCSKECCLKLFSGLSKEEFDELMGLMVPIRYRQGDLIFQEREFASGIHIICSGMVQVGRRYRGKRLILGLRKAGDMLGIEALVSERTTVYLCYAKAIEDTEVAFLERKTFLSFCLGRPAIASGLFRKALEEVDALQRKVIEFGLASVDERLAGILLELGENFGVETEAGIFISARLKRTELAELVGVSQETLSRSLSRLKKRGLIELHDHKNKIIIRDPAGLEEMRAPEPPFTSSTTSKIPPSTIPVG